MAIVNLVKLFNRKSPSPETPRDVTKSDEEWRAQLTKEQYKVLRHKSTEAPFSGELLHAKADGTYNCAACGAHLFDSTTKFDSGTGWPSFTDPAVDAAIELKRDRSLGIARTEVLCRRCGGHLGHVFNDGPGPSGQRYCINSVSLDLQTPPSP